jgi:hypothetical protein
MIIYHHITNISLYNHKVIQLMPPWLWVFFGHAEASAEASASSKGGKSKAEAEAKAYARSSGGKAEARECLTHDVVSLLVLPGS